MQELFLLTNRREALRLTARGGFVAGALAGLLGAAVAGLPWHEGLPAAQAGAGLAGEPGQRLPLVPRPAWPQELAQSARPALALSERARANAHELLFLLAQLPAFKSEAYKKPFNALRAEVQRQLEEARGLSEALGGRGATGPLGGCAAPGHGAQPLLSSAEEPAPVGRASQALR